MDRGIEQRKYARAERPFTLWLRIKSSEAHDVTSEEWDSSVSKDLGAGGVFFYYKRSLAIGSLVDLKIKVSDDTPPIDCVGKIIRTKKHLHSSIYNIAIEFTDISDQEKEMINKVVTESP